MSSCKANKIERGYAGPSHWMSLGDKNFFFRVLKIFQEVYTKWNTKPFYFDIFFCAAKGVIYHVAIATVIFSRERINRLLTEREGHIGEYWPEVVAVQTERSEVRTATTEG